MFRAMRMIAAAIPGAYVGLVGVMHEKACFRYDLGFFLAASQIIRDAKSQYELMLRSSLRYSDESLHLKAAYRISIGPKSAAKLNKRRFCVLNPSLLWFNTATHDLHNPSKYEF